MFKNPLWSTLTSIFYKLHRPAASWITSCNNIKVLCSYFIFTGGFNIQLKLWKKVSRSFTSCKLVFPQHNLTAQPKMRHLTPHSPDSHSIQQPSHSSISISIWGRKAGPKRSWDPLLRLCCHLPPPAAALKARLVALTPPFPWKSRGICLFFHTA